MVFAAIPFAGEIAGLGAATCWATCALAFAVASRQIGASAVNLLRMPPAIALLGAIHLFAFGELWPSAVTASQVIWLAVSGFIGIALADLFLFHCLALIGPRLGELVMTTAPVATALLAWPILGESLSVRGILGITVTLAGVVLVLTDRCGNNAWRSLARRRTEGIVAGLLAGVGQGTGLVLAKLGMNVSGSGQFMPPEGLLATTPLDPLSATLVRVVAGAIGIWAIAGLHGDLGRAFQAVRNRKAIRVISLATVLALLGVWLSLVSVSHTKAGISATLMGVSPILALPLAYVAYGDRPGRTAITGTFVAVLGVSCLFLAR